MVGYATSSFTACYNTGSVSGSSSVGGVVGYAFSSFTACYNTGSVSGRGSYVGGVVGYASPYFSISACYFIDQDDDDADYGVGSSTSSDYTYMKLSSVSELNAEVSTMNTAARSTYYTAGSPIDTHLPYLFDENLLYE